MAKRDFTGNVVSLLLDAVGFLSALAWLCVSTLVVRLRRSPWSSSLREWPRALRRRRSRISILSILLSPQVTTPDGRPRLFPSVLRDRLHHSARRSGQRVGNRIRTQKCMVRGILHPTTFERLPRTISRCPMKFAWSFSRTSSSGPTALGSRHRPVSERVNHPASAE